MEPVVRLETQVHRLWISKESDNSCRPKNTNPKTFGRKGEEKMSTTTELSEGKSEPRAVSSVQDIPLERIRESANNLRRAFDDGQLRELADFVPGNKTRYVAKLVMWCSDLGLWVG
jgi:hypothetical protein